MQRKSFRERAKNIGKELIKRSAEATTRGQDRFGSIFNKEKIPGNIPFWKCKEGQHVIDIVPFFAGDQHPHTKKDEINYNIDLHIHQNVGPLNKPYVCPAWNWSKPCPICEFIDENRGMLSKDEWSAKRAKRRTIYLIWVRTDSAEEKKGLQIWEVAHFFMEEKLEAIKKSPRGGGSVILGDPDISPMIVFERKGSGLTNTQYLGHRFEKRDVPMLDEILDASFALDMAINMHPTYDEIYQDFYGSKKEEENKIEIEESDDVADDIPDFDMTTCPVSDGTFGETTDKFGECNDCDIFDDCAAISLQQRSRTKINADPEPRKLATPILNKPDAPYRKLRRK